MRELFEFNPLGVLFAFAAAAYMAVIYIAVAVESIRVEASRIAEKIKRKR